MTPETVEVPPIVTSEEDADYILRVRGDSMIDAGMLDGDFVVIRPTEVAEDGQIVVALVGEEATIKRYFTEPDGSVRLQPANDSMEPIRSADVKVIGQVVGLFRTVA